MFDRIYPSRIDVYHHFPKSCEKCGYVLDSGYWDPDGFNFHLIHTINDSSVLMDRIVKDSKTRIKRYDKPSKSHHTRKG